MGYFDTNPSLAPDVQRALELSGSRYRLPQLAGSGVGVQPLTPDEQAMGAAMAQQQDAAGNAHPGMPSAAPVASGAPDLSWQPPPSAGVNPFDSSAPGGAVPPGALTGSMEPPPTELTQPLLQSTRTRGKVSVRSPYQELRSDAAARQQSAEAAASGYEAQGDEDLAAQQVAIEGQGDQAQQSAERVAGLERDMGKSNDQYLRMLQHTHAAQQDIERGLQTKIDDDAKFLQENAEPKDRRTWKTKAGQAIAIMLSGYGNALASAGGADPGPNVAMQIVQSSIDRDLENQQKMLGNRKTAMAARQDSLGQARGRYQDDRDAMQFARVMELDKWKSAVDAEIRSGLGAEAKTKAEALSAGLGQQRSDMLASLYANRGEKARTEAVQAGLAQWQLEQRASAGQDPLKRAKLMAEIDKIVADTGKSRAEAMKMLGLTPQSEADMPEGQRKQRSLLKGVAPAVQQIEQMIASGDSPSYAAQKLPDLLRSSDSLSKDASVNAVADILLRDESGAAIGKDEQEKKKRGWGITSSDPAVRREGLKRMLYEYRSRLGEQPPAASATTDPRVRPGAAR